MDANKRKILEDAGVLYPSVVTNADRIRHMSDEELAKYLAWLEDTEACYEWELYGDKDRINEWHEWLKEEFDNGN